MTKNGEDILGILSEEQVEELKDGKKLTFLIEKREPIKNNDEPTSMDTLEITWRTQGVVTGTLEENYPDVIGLGEQE